MDESASSIFLQLRPGDEDAVSNPYVWNLAASHGLVGRCPAYPKRVAASSTVRVRRRGGGWNGSASSVGVLLAISNCSATLKSLMEGSVKRQPKWLGHLSRSGATHQPNPLWDASPEPADILWCPRKDSNLRHAV